MTELVNFIVHIMTILNFRHKLASDGAFLKSFSIHIEQLFYLFIKTCKYGDSVAGTEAAEAQTE